MIDGQDPNSFLLTWPAKSKEKDYVCTYTFYRMWHIKTICLWAGLEGKSAILRGSAAQPFGAWQGVLATPVSPRQVRLDGVSLGGKGPVPWTLGQEFGAPPTPRAGPIT